MFSPNDSMAHASLGWALGASGRWYDSMLALRRAMNLDPTFEDYYSLGLGHFHLQEYQAAIEAEKKALSIEKSADAYVVLACAYAAQSQIEDALVACREAITLNHDSIEAWHNLGDAQIELGQFRDAVESFERSLTLGSSSPDTRLRLGHAYLKLGRIADAIEQCRLLDPLDHDAGRRLRDEIAAVDFKPT